MLHCMTRKKTSELYLQLASLRVPHVRRWTLANVLRIISGMRRITIVKVSFGIAKHDL